MNFNTIYQNLFAISIFIAFSVNNLSAQGDAMFINSAGNVGIGTNNPTNKLSVEGNFNEIMQIKSSSNESDIRYSCPTGSWQVGTNSSSPGEKNIFYIFDESITPTSKAYSFIVQKETGNVGIGTLSPANKLSVSGNADFTGNVDITNTLTTKILSVNGNANFLGQISIEKGISANGVADFYGSSKEKGVSLGGNPSTGSEIKFHNLGTAHFSIYNNGGKRLVFANTSATSGIGAMGNELMSLTSDGYVGIGTSTPTQGQLVVANSQIFSLGAFSYYAQGGITKSIYHSGVGVSNEGVHFNGNFGNAGGGSVYISIYATQRMAAAEFDAFSDSRIKKDFQKSDIAQDLETLRKLQITDYYYKDGLQHGFAQKKGIIAQEVEAVFPQAVNKHSDYITDIFAMPINTNLEGNILTVSMEKEHGLKNGDKVRLITPNEVAEVEVEVVDNKGFIVKNWDKKTTEVFVYGKLVDDFRSVDFDRLTILSISGVQQLCKEMEAMKAEMNQNKDFFVKELAQMKTENAEYKKALGELKKDMQSLDAKVSNVKSNVSR